MKRGKPPASANGFFPFFACSNLTVKTIPLGKKSYYILKIKGKAKIPDYIQVRDENFTLIGYFRPDRNEKIEKTFDTAEIIEMIRLLIPTSPYGKIQKIEI